MSMISMITTVLFDLGNTLIAYYERHEFSVILQQAINSVQTYLRAEGLLTVDDAAVWRRVADENHESSDHAVRPLEDRLTRIFQLTKPSDGVINAMCQRFMTPIFVRGRIYEDVVPVLTELRSRGIKTGIVSNTPWGSPAALWREELHRLDLAQLVDSMVFCSDVGWRKPARQVFDYALSRLQATPAESVFIGDDPRWDLVGPNAIGMKGVIINRRDAVKGTERIRTLYAVLDLITVCHAPYRRCAQCAGGRVSGTAHPSVCHTSRTNRFASLSILRHRDDLRLLLPREGARGDPAQSAEAD